MVLYLTSTLVFDVVHWLLHAFERSSSPWLRWLSSLHQVHHLYLNRELQFVPEWRRRNFFCHLVPERFTQIGVALIGLCFFNPYVVTALVLVLLIQLGVLGLNGGRDAVHAELARLPAPKGALWVDLGYHSLHHVYPQSYFSSVIHVFDRILGSGSELKRRIAVVDLNGPNSKIGPAFALELKKHGSDVRLYSDDSPEAATADVLVLVDLELERLDCVSRFKESKTGLLPAEVWLCSRSTDPKCAELARDPQMIFRHLPGWQTEEECARTKVARSLFRVRRGYRLIHVA